MNTENVRALAVRLRQPDAQAHFNLGDWLEVTDDEAPLSQAINHCGTVACIAGWATVLAHPDDAFADVDSAWRVGERWLDLTSDQADDLFVPSRSITGPYSSITAGDAAKVLDHLAETGVVDWSIIR